MTKRQWIWLIAAVVIFAAAGAVSVAMNTWSRQSYADRLEQTAGLISGMTETAAEFPEEEFIARLDIKGMIVSESSVPTGLASAGGFDLDHILSYIDALAECPSNAGILLYIDSGGGEMNASDEVYLKLMDYKAATGRPIYAYFDGTACSGAYYIAMAADEIWANRNCICVNIGVYISTYNLKGLFDRYGVEEIMIRSGPNKGIGSLGQEWTAEHRAIYQSIVDLYYDQFLEVVSAGRGMPKDTVKALDDGREMLASQALSRDFIDGVGRYQEYAEQVTGYFGEGVTIYEETASQTDMLWQLLQNLYGKLAALTPHSEAEILRDLAESDPGIVVMAYAG